jgi:hypothetical protein
VYIRSIDAVAALLRWGVFGTLTRTVGHMVHLITTDFTVLKAHMQDLCASVRILRTALDDLFVDIVNSNKQQSVDPQKTRLFTLIVRLHCHQYLSCRMCRDTNTHSE